MGTGVAWTAARDYPIECVVALLSLLRNLSPSHFAPMPCGWTAIYRPLRGWGPVQRLLFVGNRASTLTLSESASLTAM